MILAVQDSVMLGGLSVTQQGLIVSGIGASAVLILAYRWGTRMRGKRYKMKGGTRP